MMYQKGKVKCCLMTRKLKWIKKSELQISDKFTNVRSNIEFECLPPKRWGQIAKLYDLPVSQTSVISYCR